MQNDSEERPGAENRNGVLTHDFRLVILNAGLSRMGVMAYGIVVLWVTLALTHSTVITGLADGMVSLPLFASFIVGAYVDRSPRKKSLGAVAGIARPAAIGILFIALLVHSVLLIALLFVLGVAVIIGSVLASKVSGSVGRELTATVFLVGLFIGLIGLSPSIYYDYLYSRPSSSACPLL